tara:strand:+ start:775 stop:1095 length:321 start_codon:yes stop_codon:yes gene_type:complete
MAHTWTIADMDYVISSGGKTNVVTQVHWRCAKTVGDHTGSQYGSVGLAAVGDTFVEWADITEAIAIGWAKSALGADEVSAIEAGIDAQIAEEANPTTGEGVPWSSS